MIIAFISMVFVAVSLQLFTLNYQIQGINKTMINTPIPLIAKCISVYNDVVYFDNYEVVNVLSTYYRNTLFRYCEDYDLSFYFFNLEDHSYCTSDHCRGVEISVSCSLINNYHFTRSMEYITKVGKDG